MCDIIHICCDFYTYEEVIAARSTLERIIEDHRLPHHKGQVKEKSRKTLIDILKVVLDPKIQLPIFCTIDLSRVPPVGTDNIDVVALLQEIVKLRNEVRNMASLHADIEEVKLSLKGSCMHADSGNNVILHPTKVTKVISDVQSIDQQIQHNDNTTLHSTDVKLFADFARELPGSSGLNVKRAPKQHIKPVVGASATNKHVKSVTTVRTVDVFVSRLHPQTAKEELVDCVRSVDCPVKVIDVKCEKLKSKFEELYSSFHVSIKVDS